MNRSRTPARLPGRIRGWVRRRLRGDDGGFILLESIIAISLITVIMGAVGAEYISGLAATSHQRAQTIAIQLADTAVENLRSLHPSDMITGRDKVSVTTEYNKLKAIPAVAPWLSSDPTRMAYDTTVATGGSSATVPTTPVTQYPGVQNDGTGNKLPYQVYEYLECTASTATGLCITVNGALNYIRAVVAVTWNQRGCAASTCSYTTSTTINTDGDPTFDLNQALPPAPVIADQGAQTVAVGDAVSLQYLVQNGKGVAPFTWTVVSGSLPSNLSLSPAGLVSGTVGGSAGTATTIIQVTDAFLRTATLQINWTILPQLVFNPVAPQANLTTDSVNLTVSAAGGTGSGYTYSDPTGSLPPGLTLNAATGKITGTPQTPAPRTYTVQLAVTDGSGKRTATTSFTWSISYPPLVLSNPKDQSSTLGIAVNLPLSASGGDGNYAWSATGLPGGLSINASTGKITGTPTSSGGPSAVTVTVTDTSAGVSSQQVTFNWTVYKAPTIGSQSGQKSTAGGPAGYQVLGASCPNGGCTYSMTGQPSGLSINPSTGYISGPAASNATSSTITVTVKDSAGATASTSFNWTIYGPPTLTGVATNTGTEGAVESVQIGYTCPFPSCRITLGSGAMPGVGLETSASVAGDNSGDTALNVSGTSGSVYLTGTVQNSAVTGAATSKNYTMNLTITDGGGFSPAPSSATWTAYVPPTFTGLSNASFSQGSSPSQKLTYTCPAGGCTAQVTTTLPGIGLDTNTTGSVSASLTLTGTSGTFYVRGAISGSQTKQGYPVTVTITDANGAVVTSAVTWTVK